TIFQHASNNHPRPKDWIGINQASLRAGRVDVKLRLQKRLNKVPITSRASFVRNRQGSCTGNIGLWRSELSQLGDRWVAGTVTFILDWRIGFIALEQSVFLDICPVLVSAQGGKQKRHWDGAPLPPPVLRAESAVAPTRRQRIFR